MKVLLVQPPVRDFYETSLRLQPLGLCYLKGAVKKFLPEVEVLIRDYHAGLGRRTVPVPAELSYLNAYYGTPDSSPFSLFHNYYHFGKSYEEIGEELMEIAPDVVGISSLFSAYHMEALEVAACVKQRLGVPVIVGGTHATEVPDFVLSRTSVDYVIRGEGERPFVEFIRFMQGKCRIEDVPNLGYKKAGQIFFNLMTDPCGIDEIPFPDLGDFSPDRYMHARRPLSLMMTSRGCPHQCSFCSVHATFGTRYRRRSTDSILDEIKLRYNEGYRFIDFEDDNLSFDREEFTRLLKALISIFPEREMEFAAMNGISYMSLDADILSLMKQAGFSHLNLSLVSADRDVRNQSLRPHTIDAYSLIVDAAFRLGFRIVSYQILGLPYEELDSMIRTLGFQGRIPVLLGASPFYLTPGCLLARGMTLTEHDYVKARLTALAVETGLWDRDDIYTLFVATRIINFLKGLELPASAGLVELMNMHWEDSRRMVGIELLRSLMQDGVLYFRTSSGNVINTKFRVPLFMQVLREMEYVCCQNGRKIDIDVL